MTRHGHPWFRLEMHTSAAQQVASAKDASRDQVTRQAMQTVLDPQEYQPELLFKILGDERVQTTR